MRWRALGAVFLFVLALANSAPTLAQTIPPTQQDRQQEQIPEGVPDHYPALRAYAEGEILEVLGGGMALRLRVPGTGGRVFEPPEPLRDPRGLAGVTDRTRLPGLDDRPELIVDLKNAKGWIFIDAPDGGPQERVRLADGREIFAPGQIVEIGPAPGLTSKATEGGGASRAFGRGGGRSVSTPQVLYTRGWIYIRLNRFRQRHQ